MRTIIKIAIFCLLFYFNSISGQNFNLGISIGADLTSVNNYTKLSHEVESSFNLKKETVLNYNLNLIIQKKISNKFGLKVSPGYLRKGYELYSEFYSTKWNYDYVNLPLLIQYYLKENISITLGPEVSYLLKLNVVDKESNFNVRKEDINLNNFDIALNFGIEYEINKKLGFSMNYSHGLIPFFTEYYLDPGFSLIILSNTYHQYFQFAAKYFFW